MMSGYGQHECDEAMWGDVEYLLNVLADVSSNDSHGSRRLCPREKPSETTGTPVIDFHQTATRG